MTTGIFLHFSYIRFFWLIMALAAMASEFKDSDIPAPRETIVN
jgi:hypothetical protein